MPDKKKSDLRSGNGCRGVIASLRLTKFFHTGLYRITSIKCFITFSTETTDIQNWGMFAKITQADKTVLL